MAARDDRKPTPLGMAILQRMAQVGMFRQRDLSEAAGVADSTISRLIYIEQRQPNVEVLRRLETALQMPRNALVDVVLDEATPQAGEVDPLLAEIGRYLDPESVLTEAERALLRELLTRVVLPYRHGIR